jgi:imidazolonepropionase-like amidohydrolase
MRSAIQALAATVFSLGLGAVQAEEPVADRWPSVWGPPPVEKVIALRTSTLLDGKGGTLRDTVIVVRGGKVERIGGPVPQGAVVYDLKGLTVAPGLIDTHEHVTYHFRNGRFVDNRLVGGDEPVADSALYAAENGWEILQAGFTTIQSPGPGTAWDISLREAWARNIVPGPRMLTSLEWFRYDLPGQVAPAPDELRALVRERKAKGADFIKIFASMSVRDGSKPTLTQPQLDALCDEARKEGLRTLVHAYTVAVKMAVQAGCTAIEHGTRGMTDEVMAMMARQGTYYDPTMVATENYVANKSKFVGIGNYTEEAFAGMEESVRHARPQDEFQRALKVKGLKMVYGSDGVAGAHGHNAEGLLARIRAGQAPMDAIVAATSAAAESMGLGSRIGSVQPGMEADIIAMGGDFLKDPTAMREIVFVMKGGKVYKYLPRSQARR